MKRLVACLVAPLTCIFPACSSTDDRDALERFVRAWPRGGSALAATVTGHDVDELVSAMRGLATDGVERADLVRASGSDGSLDGIVSLHFADGARLESVIRARIERGRVRADPASVSTELTAWRPLHFERFGKPQRGSIHSRDGVRLARGPSGKRDVSRRSLRPAAELIDEALDARLGGKRGVRLVAGSADVLASSPPVDGADVVTSLDDELQRAAEDMFGSSAGALVAVDPRSGGIRALVSRPQPDAPEDSPASSGYSPGSTFKIVTAAAALEGDVLDIGDRVGCPPRISTDARQIRNFGGIGYGRVTFEKAFAVSCNTAFAQIGMAVGTTKLLRTARRLGFSVGDLDAPETISVPRSRSELALWSFGAAGSRVSPMHMAGIGSSIAHDGITVVPGWTDSGNVGHRALSASTAGDLVTMMEEVVATGTGRNARVANVRIAGKTGTADPERSGGRSDAWFVGLAPSRSTELVAVAFLPGAGIGGQQPATLVRRFLVTAGVG